jgi:trigger factor
MNLSIKDLEKSKKELEIEIPKEEFQKYYQESLNDAAKDAEIEGFRKGKAPKEVVEEKIGKEKILFDASERAIKENYINAVAEKKLEVLGEPKIEIVNSDPKEPLKFKAIVSVMPSIELPDYKEIAKKVERKKIDVEEKEVNDNLEYIRKTKAKFTLKTEPAQKGDWVEIEYTIKGKDKDSSPSYKDSFVLGEGKLVKGFEEKIVGMKTEEEKDFTLPLKEETSFHVKVKSIQNMEMPPLDDSFAQELRIPGFKEEGFQNLNALKQAVEANIKRQKESEEVQRHRRDILDKIAKKTEIDIPDILIEEQKRKFLENMKNEVSQKLNMEFKDYLEKIKKTEEDILKSFKEPAEKQVKTSLVLREIQRKENIEVKKEEIDKEVERLKKAYQGQEIDQDYLRRYTEEVIRQEKAFKILEQS